MGIEAAGTNEKTVAGWNILLRANREHFPHPNPRIRKDKKPLPELLEYFQKEITIQWQQFCIENLADLTIEFARDELISNIIPTAFEASNDMSDNERGNEESQNEDDKNRFQRIKDC